MLSGSMGVVPLPQPTLICHIAGLEGANRFCDSVHLMALLFNKNSLDHTTACCFTFVPLACVLECDLKDGRELRCSVRRWQTLATNCLACADV